MVVLYKGPIKKRYYAKKISSNGLIVSRCRCVNAGSGSKETAFAHRLLYGG